VAEPKTLVSLPIEIPSKPEVWTVQISGVAANVAEILPLCTDAIPGVSLLVSESPVMDDVDADFVIASEYSVQAQSSNIILAKTDLVVINHLDNPFKEISLQNLQGIYSGEIMNWNETNFLSSYAGDFERISYIENSDLSIVIEQSVGSTLSGKFSIVSDPEGVVKAVSEDVNAIGIVPVWALNSSVKKLSVDAGELNYHVVVSAQNQSEEAQNWLQCLAEKTKSKN